MTAESVVKLLQMTGAAFAIPAAAAGTFAAYQSYFSAEVTCQKLRNNVVAIMERNVAPETKRSLLKKDVTEFDKLCRLWVLGLKGANQDSFVTDVIARLNADGFGSTTPQVIAAATKELHKGK